MAIPQLTPMPPAPVPTDPENVFDQKAGDYLVAQVQLVAELNEEALPWVADQLAQTQAARDAAISARNAAQQAEEGAEQSAVDATENGAAQVQLATHQAGQAADSAAEAKAYRDSAQAAATAAGEGAGLPSQGNVGDVLTLGPGNTASYKPPQLPVELPKILRPANVAPAVGSIKNEPILTLGPYYSLYSKPQRALRFQISKTADFASVVYDTGITTLSPAVAWGETVFFRGAYQDIDEVWSDWSVPTSFVVRPLPAPGTPLEGGFFIGRQSGYAGGVIKGLILAPKSYEFSAIWGPVSPSVPGATSSVDGLANTNAIIAVHGTSVSATAAAKAKAVSAGGYSDFYMAAYFEIALAFTLLGQNSSTAPPAFKVGGSESLNAWQWSSTQSAGNSSNATNNNGESLLKTSYTQAVRAIRAFTVVQ